MKRRKPLDCCGNQRYALLDVLGCVVFFVMRFPWLQPPSGGFGVPRSVHDPVEAAKWLPHACDNAIRSGICTLAQMAKTLPNRVVSTSGSFVGIGTGNVVERCITNSVQGRLLRDAIPDVSPIQFDCKWSIEWNQQCINEVCNNPDSLGSVVVGFCPMHHSMIQ